MPPSHLPLITVDTREVERIHPTNPNRTVGKDMLTLLQSHPSAPPCRGQLLPAGDFCFTGMGTDGPAQFGIERKRTKDMLTSMRTGRFSGEQLPKLFDYYDYVYLVVESKHRTNFKTGIMEEKQWNPATRRYEYMPVAVGKSTFLGLELDSFLNSISRTIPIVVLRTRDEEETISAVVSLAHTFSKPWSKHTAHVAIHMPPQYATVGKASTVRRVAFAVEGIGWEKSGIIDQHYSRVTDFVNASPGELQKLPGFGKALSKKVHEQFRGEWKGDK